MGFNLIASDKAGLPAFLQEMGGYQDEGLAAGIQARAPKIGLTIDKHFTITKDGQTVILQQEMTDNAGRKVAVPVSSINVIIVAASQTLTKAWYEQAYVAGSSEAPDCYSNDGKVPAPGVAKPQHTNCAQCPKNMFGSNPVTGRGKACSDRKMIVCVWEGAPDELMTWNVPTMSLQSLGKFDSELRNANIPMQSVAVELFFDPSVQYPVVKLNALGFVDKETALRWKEASQSTEVMSLLREVDYEPATAQSPVPQNTIKFGETTAGGSATAAATTTADTGGGVANATTTPEPTKRVRRTKAQVEADRLAAVQAGTQTTVQVDLVEPETPAPETAPVVEEDDEEAALMRKLEEARARKAAEATQQSAPAVDPKVAELQAQLAAALAASQQTVVSTAQQAEVVTPDPTAQTEAPPRRNVMDMLAKWKAAP